MSAQLTSDGPFVVGRHRAESGIYFVPRSLVVGPARAGIYFVRRSLGVIPEKAGIYFVPR